MVCALTVRLNARIANSEMKIFFIVMCLIGIVLFLPKLQQAGNLYVRGDGAAAGNVDYVDDEIGEYSLGVELLHETDCCRGRTAGGKDVVVDCDAKEYLKSICG